MVSRTYVSTSSGHCMLRMGLWILTVVGALLPSVLASDSQLSLWIWQMAADTDAKGLFAEFYFVVIVIAIFGLGNVAHNGFTSGKRPHVWVAAIGLILVGFYAIVLIEGTGRFGTLITMSRSGIIPQEKITHDVNLILLTMAIGLATEIAIALRDMPETPT